MRGTFLHSWLGDRILAKGLWSPSRESLARAWLVGWPITVIPFLPGQSIFACLAALLIRGNLLLCIGLQFLSNPFTATVHLPACYFVGELVRGAPPKKVWREVQGKMHILSKMDEFKGNWRNLLTVRDVMSLYLGGAVVGMVGGAVGYAVIHGTWRDKPRRRRETFPPMPTDTAGTGPPFDTGAAEVKQLKLPLRTEDEKVKEPEKPKTEA